MDLLVFEPIGNNIEVCVSKAHTFGTDSFLLADFARPKRRDNACDLGTGCGIIPLLWLRGDSPANAWGVDIQPEAIAQLEQSIKKCNLSGRLTPILTDIKEIKKHLPAGSMDLVTCNPPYSLAGSGVASPTDSRKIARHETLCTIDDICKAAAWLLHMGGRFCICQLPERLVDVLAAMRENRIEPKRIRMVQQQASSAPWLILVEGKRESKPFMSIEPPLIMREGAFISEEIKRIYNIYGKV